MNINKRKCLDWKKTKARRVPHRVENALEKYYYDIRIYEHKIYNYKEFFLKKNESMP